MATQHRFGILVLVSSLFVVATVAETQPRSSDRQISARIDGIVAQVAEMELVSGAILIARGDDILYERAYGFANWELRVPNSPLTRFGIASITKALTETLVDALVREGRLNLDSAVQRYLPGFPQGPGGGVATVRHLLTHRSGVPHRVTDQVDETQSLRPSDIVERVRARGLLFEPGTRRLYSSAGFTCLARVIEVVEQRSFDSVLAERVFKPAGMVGAVGETGQQLMLHRARPHRLAVDGGRVVVASAPYKDLRFLTGAGSVYATARDLWHFIKASRAGVFGVAQRDQVVDRTATTWRGWTGRTNGYEAFMDVLPGENLAFVFLSNLQSAANWQIQEQVRNMLTGRNTTPLQLPPRVARPFEVLASLVGSYGSVEAPVEIFLVDGKPFRADNEFYPIEGGRYYIPGSGSIMQFRRDAAGSVDAIVTISGGGQETILSKLAAR